MSLSLPEVSKIKFHIHLVNIDDKLHHSCQLPQRNDSFMQQPSKNSIQSYITVFPTAVATNQTISIESVAVKFEAVSTDI
jgi:hypothetical protein